MKIAVITGGTGGIGYCLCEGFNAHGYKVIALDIAKLRPLNENIDFMQVDLSSEREIISAFADIVQKYGAIHILINNGAIAHFSKNLYDISTDEFEHILSVNLRGAFICVKQFIEANKGQKYGRIINISSTRSMQNEPGWEAYGASKGGMVSLTNTLAVSLAETPITVNAVSPGWIECENYNSLSEADHKQHPAGRVGLPRDIFNVCLFLADEENDFINAANIVVDGGITKKMIYLEEEV